MAKIIIDDIDVSGCKYINELLPFSEYSGCGHFCEGTECKYKRLYWKKLYLQEKQKRISILNREYPKSVKEVFRQAYKSKLGENNGI